MDMKAVVAVILLLSVVEGSVFWKDILSGQWRGPPQQSSYSCPPGQSCSLLGQSFQQPIQTFHQHRESFQPPGAPFPYPGFVPGKHHPQNWKPQQQQPSTAIDISNAEWVCHNPKTGNMMIIATVDGTEAVTNGPPQNELPNREENPTNGNSNIGNPGSGANPTPGSDADESSKQHGGEGLIDIRMGSN